MKRFSSIFSHDWVLSPIGFATLPSAGKVTVSLRGTSVSSPSLPPSNDPRSATVGRSYFRSSHVSTEAGIVIGTKHILSAIGATLVSAWAGWRMFFSLKVRQLDELSDSHRLLSAQLNQHIEDESGEFEKITNSLERVHTRLDDMWKFLAGQK